MAMNAAFIPMTSWLSVLIWQAAWKSALLLAVAGAVALAMHRRSAAWRHLVWTTAMAGSLILPLCALCVPSWSWSVLPGRATGPSLSLQTPFSDGTGTTRGVQDVAGDSTRQEASSAAVMHEAIATASPPSRITLSGIGLLTSLWMLGALVILVIQLCGWLSLRALVRQTVPPDESTWEEMGRELERRFGLGKVRFLCSDRVLMPMTWGWLRPVVLLPRALDGWPQDRLRTVLLHELAHVQRRDWLTQTIAHLACAVYWFNPLVWLAARRMRDRARVRLRRCGPSKQRSPQRLCGVVAEPGPHSSVCSTGGPCDRGHRQTVPARRTPRSDPRLKPIASRRFSSACSMGDPRIRRDCASPGKRAAERRCRATEDRAQGHRDRPGDKS